MTSTPVRRNVSSKELQMDSQAFLVTNKAEPTESNGSSMERVSEPPRPKRSKMTIVNTIAGVMSLLFNIAIIIMISIYLPAVLHNLLSLNVTRDDTSTTVPVVVDAEKYLVSSKMLMQRRSHAESKDAAAIIPPFKCNN
ncbi:hypothetical protein B566_EDAN016648, partial [Ephemera danica]